MPPPKKRKPGGGGTESMKTIQLRSHAHVFGFMSLHGGIVPFLAGRGREDFKDDEKAEKLLEDDVQRAHRVLTRAFGDSALGQELHVQTLAVDISSELRRMIAPGTRETFSASLANLKLKKLRECVEKGNRISWEPFSGKNSAFDIAIERSMTAAIFDCVRSFEGKNRIAAFVSSVEQVCPNWRSDLSSELKASVESAAKVSSRGCVQAATILEEISLLCDTHSNDACISSIKTLLDILNLDHVWHSQMYQLEKDLASGALVRLADMKAEGQRLIDSGAWVCAEASPKAKKQSRKMRPKSSAPSGKAKKTVPPLAISENHDGTAAKDPKETYKPSRRRESVLSPSRANDSAKIAACVEAPEAGGKRMKSPVRSRKKLPPQTASKQNKTCKRVEDEVLVPETASDPFHDPAPNESENPIEVTNSPVRRSPRAPKPLMELPAKNGDRAHLKDILVISDSDIYEVSESEQETGSDYVLPGNVAKDEDDEEEPSDEEENSVQLRRRSLREQRAASKSARKNKKPVPKTRRSLASDFVDASSSKPLRKKLTARVSDDEIVPQEEPRRSVKKNWRVRREKRRDVDADDFCDGRNRATHRRTEKYVLIASSDDEDHRVKNQRRQRRSNLVVSDYSNDGRLVSETSGDDVIPVSKSATGKKRRRSKKGDGHQNDHNEEDLHVSRGSLRGAHNRGRSSKRPRFSAPADTQLSDPELENMTREQRYLVDLYSNLGADSKPSARPSLRDGASASKGPPKRYQRRSNGHSSAFEMAPFDSEDLWDEDRLPRRVNRRTRRYS